MDILPVLAPGAAAPALLPRETVPQAAAPEPPARLPAPEARVPDLVQGLAQILARQSLPTAILFPVAGSDSAPEDPLPGLAGALLATEATRGGGEGPERAMETAARSSTSVPKDLPAVQDAATASTGPDFALLTALRFGAGVAPLAAPPFPNPDLATGLVRDAASVPRLGNLRPDAGRLGPEAFAPPAAIQRFLRAYEAAPAAEAPQGLDLQV